MDIPAEHHAEHSAEKAVEASLGLVTQAWRFIVTGGLSAIVDYGLYVLLSFVFVANGMPDARATRKPTTIKFPWISRRPAAMALAQIRSSFLPVATARVSAARWMRSRRKKKPA